MSKQSIQWRNYIIELLVVIIGISIAFMLEGWSAGKKQDTLERNYLNSLKSDLLKDKEDLQEIMDSTTVLIKNVGTAFQLIYGKRPDSEFRRHHVTSTYLATYFYPQNGTYVSLINSGDISVVKDFELKKSLSNLYNIEYQEMERVDNVVRNLVDNMLHPYMINNVEFSITRDGIESADPLKANRCINMMGSYFNLLSYRQQHYQALLAKCDALIAEVEKAIGS